MEEDQYHNGFKINNSRVPITLSLRPIQSLRPHEEVVSHELGLIIHDLEHENLLRHPLIVDESTGVILDGTHRLAALKALDCRLVPCALVEYNDPRILVERWYRIITGSDIESFVIQTENNTRKVKTDAEAEKCLSLRQCYASMEDGKSFKVFPCAKMTPLELIRSAYKLEQTAKENRLRVKYADSKRESSSSNRLILTTVRLNKPEIVESALAGLVFPPKTTRHIIPSRPLGTSTPLELLRSEQPGEAQTMFVNDLKSKHVRRMPEGSKIGSRRYTEEVFVFA